MWRVEATPTPHRRETTESVYHWRESTRSGPGRGVGAGETADVRRAFGSLRGTGRGPGIRSRPSPGPAGASRGGLGAWCPWGRAAWGVWRRAPLSPLQ